MSVPQAQYQGITCTDKYLSVHFTFGEHAAKRFHEVKVPIMHLSQDSVLEALDNTIRRRLIEAWSGVDIADPLF